MKYRTFSILTLLALLVVSVVPLAAQDTTECEAGFRLFDHEYLATDPVCIPENSERIVAAWPFNITALLRADAPIVGMIDQEFVIGQFPEWEAELAEITDLGRPLNLEMMLTLEPDLIIAPSFLAENPDTLTAIAPTVLFEWEGTHIWREVTELMFDAAGEREAFEAILAEQDSRIAELSGLLGDATTQELSLVNVRPDSVFLYTQYSPGGMIAEELGFARPEAQLLPVTPDELADNPDAYPNFAPYFAPYLQEASLELIDRAAGDFIIVFGNFNTDDEAQTYLDEVTENPLWQTLDAVQAGDVFVSAVNYAGGDIGNAHFMLDDIAEAFGVAEELSPNPYTIKAPLPALETETAIGCEAGFRLITHAMGETCVTEAPQRVVVLDTGETDNALALGAPVVGAPISDVNQYQAYLTSQLDGIVDTGTISEPNLEVILSLSPDLILGSSQRYEAIYEELSLIAPTVFTESLRVPWQDNFTLHAAALDREAEAKELLAGYDAHIAEVQAVLGDNLDNTTISIIRFRPGQVRLYLKSSYIGYILQDIGLPRPASQDEDVFSAEISLEEVQAVDADYIFITGYAQYDSDQDIFLNSPLWQTLEAVQNERAIDVNDDTWIAGLGVQAANLVLDDLETILADATE